MKRFIVLSLVGLLLLGVCGCAKDKKPAAVLPPVRKGTGKILLHFAKKPTFESELEDAEAVALVRIGDWLGEDMETDQTTYEAATIQCFKGNLPDTFHLYQDGTSLATVPNYPLFTDGNELLLFLSHNPEKNSWGIIGSFSTVLYRVTTEEKVHYIVDRFGILGESMDKPENLTPQRQIISKVAAAATASDSVAFPKGAPGLYSYIFAEDELQSLIENHTK